MTLAAGFLQKKQEAQDWSVVKYATVEIVNLSI
jgi:hypothetical protein